MKKGSSILAVQGSKVVKVFFFFGPYLLCIHPEAVEPFLEELHEGICGSHMGGRSLSNRVQIYKRKHKNMRRSVTNVRGLLQTFTSWGAFLILCLVLGLLLNRAWTL